MTFQQVFRIYFYSLSLNIGSFSVQFLSLPTPVLLTSCQQQPLILTAPEWFHLKCFCLCWLSECKNQPPGLVFFIFKELKCVLPAYGLWWWPCLFFCKEQTSRSLVSSMTAEGPLHCYFLTLPLWLVPNVCICWRWKMGIFDLEKLPNGCRSFVIS